MSIKNIVIVNDRAYVSGGAGKVAFMSGKELARRGYRVIVFAAAAPIDKSLEEAGVEVICLGQHGILQEKNRLKAAVQGIWNVKAYKEFKRLLTTLNPHETIIHFHGWTKALSASVLFAASRYKIPIAVTIHDYFLFCPNGGLYDYTTHKICNKHPYSCSCYLTNCDSRNYLQKIWRILRLYIQNKTLCKNKKITFLYISEMSKKNSLPYLPQGTRMMYLPNPVELGDNETVNISNNEYYLYLGRLSPEKGADLFCKALTELGLKGLLVGDGHIKQELQTKYPHMEFAGWASGERKKQLMRRAKALIFPSLWYETFGLTVAEAKSYGIPCIVPDRCAASEQVEDGITGYIFKIGDVESLKKAIIKYEKTDIIQMQKNIQESFHPENFSLDNHIKRLESVYADIMRSHLE